jgi:hypothetical protein
MHNGGRKKDRDCWRTEIYEQFCEHSHLTALKK